MPTSRTLRRALPTLCLLSLSGVAFAQSASPSLPVLPNAGSLLRQLQPDGAATPSTATIALPTPPAQAAIAASSDGGLRFEVRSLRLTGIDDDLAAAMQPLLKPYVGAGKSLADLERAAKDIEVALQRRGLFLARVCVPQQRLTSGVATLLVYPGRIGQLTLDIAPDAGVDHAFVERIVEPLRAHPVIESGLIERVLFTLGDLRGITVGSSLTPGQQVGEADLTVRVTATSHASTTVEYDNAGSVYTGRNRVYLTQDIYNLSGLGDLGSLKAQASRGSYYLRPSWLVPVNAQGTRLGVSASYLHYRLGTAQFDPLDASGDAYTAGVMALHPLIRSRNSNLFLQASLETRGFHDEVRAIDLDARKGVTTYLNLGVAGDFRDTLGGGGITNYSAQWVHGRLHLDTPSEAALDAATYRSAGIYDKLVLGASRLQSLPNHDALYVSVQAQAASKNLDSSEKFDIGGLYADRAYPAGESPSDEGAMLTWEYRMPLNPAWRPLWVPAGDYVFSVFGDYAYARLHNAPLGDDTSNQRHLQSHGIALTYGSPGSLYVRAALALRGDTPALSDDRHLRFLLQASHTF